jgi:hypothetical protein
MKSVVHESGPTALPNEETILVSVIRVGDCREMRKLGDVSVFVPDADDSKTGVGRGATWVWVGLAMDAKTERVTSC